MCFAVPSFFERVKKTNKKDMASNPLVPIILLVGALHLCVVTASSDDCNVYLAKSSLKKAGWGVFVTRDYDEGETIVSGITISGWTRCI